MFKSRAGNLCFWELQVAPFLPNTNGNGCSGFALHSHPVCFWEAGTNRNRRFPAILNNTNFGTFVWAKDMKSQLCWPPDLVGVAAWVSRL